MGHSKNKLSETEFSKAKWEIVHGQQTAEKEKTSLLTTQEKERAKIAYEIQENLNQLLIAALLYIELAKTDDQSREMCLDRSSSFISTVIKELTAISRKITANNSDIRLLD